MYISLIAPATTTAGVLMAYAANARDYGYRDIELLIVGDRGESTSWQDFCASITTELIPCRLFSLAQQRDLLQTYCPDLFSVVRLDGTRRPHLGFLDAWLNGASVLIGIHPDCPPGKSDFVGAQVRALRAQRQFQLQARTDWFNLAATLEEENSHPFSLRGYPPQLSVQQSLPPVSIESCMVAANAGMLTGASDLSAATRLRSELRVVGFKPELPTQFTLPRGVWSPFSVQNLAMWRDCVPAYFLNPYAGRFDDIWASFILTRIAHHLGQSVCFGSPVLAVETMSSNTQRDFEQELVGYRQSLGLATALRAIPLGGTSFHECLGEVAAALPGLWPEVNGASGIEIEARNKLLSGLKLWHQLFATVAARSTGNLFESIAQRSAGVRVSEEVSKIT